MRHLERHLPKSTHHRVVLLAEDEVLVMTIARIALEAEGYFVLTARDGEEALEVSRDFAGSIHVLVADVRMPNMDGIELRERILAERPEIKVLLMSAYAGKTQVEGVPFLRKPFHLSVLKQRVRELFESAVAA